MGILLKGTTAVCDDDHLVFANIRSTGTLANLRQNPSVEVNGVDPFVRKVYRLKGQRPSSTQGRSPTRRRLSTSARSQIAMIREIVMIRIASAQPVDSPAYDLGLTEEEVRDRWQRHFDSLRSAR
jgi:hypothetical protein